VLTFPEVSIHITNVCNYNCTNCHHYSNYHFSGHYYWNNYKDIFQQWATRINFQRIYIQGGEPLLHPDIEQWLQGIRNYWPNAEIILSSNGSRIKFHPDIYNWLLKYNITLKISAHNRNIHNDIILNCITLLTQPVSKMFDITYTDLNNKWLISYNYIKNISWLECNTINDYNLLPAYVKNECKNIHKIDPDTFISNITDIILIDNNKVRIIVAYAEHFDNISLQLKNNKFYLPYKNNPIKAHNACRQAKCYHIIDGLMSKCAMVPLLLNFNKQHKIDMDSDTLKLLTAYEPLSATDSIDKQKIFLQNIDNPIPQCTLCPTTLSQNILFASNKKT